MKIQWPVDVKKELSWNIVLIIVISFIQPSINVQIDQLEGQAGFRMASLRWSYPLTHKDSLSFRVRYCELHPWGLHRCRYQTVDEATARTGRQEAGQRKEDDDFIVDIGGLRMATNYSFQVVPQDPIQKFGVKPSQIALQTKGFSAKATKCLADSSEVSVETGPFFGGRISVEDAKTPGCYVKGNPQSSQTKYTLRIRHKECGSIIDGSKVTSVIVVQENVPILTHSTRRFVVVCSFSPDSFIVKAGVTLPRDTSVAKSLDFSRLIRLPPQKSNMLNTEFEVNSQTLPNQEQNVIPANLEDEARFVVSHLHADRDAASESRAFAEKLHRGTWETFLVFGMICAAIIASMASVIWFIKSYRSSGVPGNAERIMNGDESFDSSSSYSYDGSPSFSSEQNNSNADNRSEIEVELDFEFSEDVNQSNLNSYQTPNEVTLNNSSSHNYA